MCLSCEATLGCRACARRLHEFCLRGWVIVGAKDSCPFCASKVVLKDIVGSSPWDPQSTAFLNVLDAVRYMIVWYPALMMLLQFLISIGHHPADVLPE